MGALCPSGKSKAFFALLPVAFFRVGEKERTGALHSHSHRKRINSRRVSFFSMSDAAC